MLSVNPEQQEERTTSVPLRITLRAKVEGVEQNEKFTIYVAVVIVASTMTRRHHLLRGHKTDSNNSV